AWLRRKHGGPSERASTVIVVALGVAAPLALISALFVVSDVFVIRTTQAPAATDTSLTVRVIGRQWYWEVRYPGAHVVTANEIHIPVRTRVLLAATTDDVIHSVWVPRLNRKIDTIPGQTNRIVLEADAAGRYRGQCSEFCGLQHAHMALIVFAQPRAAFRAWLAGNARPARPPAHGRAAPHARRLSGVAALMAVAEERVERLESLWAERPGVLGWLTTTDHKRIGLLYFWATLVLFAAGGVEALIMRTQLATAN